MSTLGSEDDDFLPLSALRHLAYCERSVALIHVLGRWSENVHTVTGRIAHERIDGGETSSQPGVVTLRSVPVRSARLRVRGVADVVEVYTENGAIRLVPVEHKKGGRRRPGSDDLQLAAQAMALEEMTGLIVPEGAFFLGKVRRRRVMAIDAPVRDRVERAAVRLHALVAAREVPRAQFDHRCLECSLRDECSPDLDLPRGALAGRIAQALEDP